MLKVVDQSGFPFKHIVRYVVRRVGNVLLFSLCVDEYTTRSEAASHHVFWERASNPFRRSTSDEIDPGVNDLIHPVTLGCFNKWLPVPEINQHIHHFLVFRIQQIAELT